MTINSEVRVSGPYTGNGSTTAFPFTFKVFAADELLVVSAADSVETVLVLGSDYTVALNADQDSAPGGTVTLAAPLATGKRLTLTSALEYLQPVDLTNQGGFYPRVINNAFDRLTILQQQLFERLGRALVFPISDGPVGEIPGAGLRAGSVLAFDNATGDPVVGPSIADVNTVVGANAAIATVASNIADVNTVADNIGDVNAVGQNISNVNAVVTNLPAIQTVNANIVDVQTVADNVASVSNFADVYFGASAVDPTTRRDGTPLQVGDLYFNTTIDALRSYNGTAWRGVPNGSITVQNLSGDGVETEFLLDYAPENEAVTSVFISGVYQQKNTYELGGVGGSTLIFDAPPPSGAGNIEVVVSALQPSDDKLRQDLAAPSGTTLIGDLFPSVGSVPRSLNKVLEQRVDLLKFGDVSALAANSAETLDTLRKAFDYMVAVGGGTLYVPPGDYHLGSYSTSVNILTIAGLSNCKIEAYGARFLVNTVTQSTPFAFYFLNPNNVVFAGARFFDTGFDPGSWETHSRWGIGAVRLNATEQCRGFKMVDCAAENLTYFLVADLRANKRKITDISVVDCRVKNAYYGVDTIYAGDNLKIDNLVCEDVRRGFIAFGPRNADVDIKLYTRSGFFGSNAFVSIACEGEDFNDSTLGGTGVIGTEANVENVRVKLNVSGFESHSNYVHFYHQKADGPGYIANCDADVKLNNLSASGKNPGITNTNAIIFDHELSNGAILGTTSRKFKQVSCSGGIVGSITGLPVVVASVNNSDKHTIALSPTLTSLSQNLALSNLTAGVDWLTPFERPLPTLTPVGATTAGLVTGLVSEGTYTTIGKRVFFNAFLSWTGHSGTGHLRLSGLPLPVNSAAPSGDAPLIGIGGSLNHSAGSQLLAIAGGAGASQILIYEETAGTIAALPVKASAAGVYISGTYLAQ